MKQIPNLRWWIAILLGSASALAYMDRQALPVVIGAIQKTIPVTDAQYAHLQFMFLLAYGIMYAGGGKVSDVLGARWGYVVIITWWSAANLMQGAVSSVFGLGLGLFLLGIGEGGGFPTAAKAVAEWFPAKERALAFGIFNAGSGIGATVAPPIIAVIVLQLNWRWVFFLTAALGFIWAAGWLGLYYPPARHKRLTGVERNYLTETIPPAPVVAERVSWIGLFRFRQIWGLLAAKFLTDSAWYFFIFWLPKYLIDVRHLNIKQIGYYAWIPYAFAAVGSFAGGWLSSVFIRHGLTVDTSRKVCLGISAAMMPVSLLIASAPLSMAIAFFSMVLFAHQFWSTILQTLAADMFPSRIVGSVAGLMGAVGSFGAMLFGLFVGLILTHYHSYSGVLTIAGLLHPCSFLLIMLLVRKIEPVVRPNVRQNEGAVA